MSVEGVRKSNGWGDRKYRKMKAYKTIFPNGLREQNNVESMKTPTYYSNNDEIYPVKLFIKIQLSPDWVAIVREPELCDRWESDWET